MSPPLKQMTDMAVEGQSCLRIPPCTHANLSHKIEMQSALWLRPFPSNEWPGKPCSGPISIHDM
jgi:hypothetical protein